MQLARKKLSEIKPYERNPRKNDPAVDAVAESIRQCGYVAPIIIDEDGIILAGHIRYLRFSFYLEIPYYVSVHLVRHVHAQPYVRSQRNDRQDAYDRCAARQDAPVSMIWDLNAEELMVVANKRLCRKADPVTREVVERMRECLLNVAPEVCDMMWPMCVYAGGVCHEMEPCGKGGAHGEG